ncbi:hypothetical protein MASR2M66_27590 [Chloroflexota bacterium]
MDFLLNPNVAYVILVSGVVLTFFAMATPGTGVAEVAALFCFVLAGYAAYNLSIHAWALVLLALSVPPFILAVRNPSKWLIYLGACVFFMVGGSVFLFATTDSLISVNPWLALFVSALTAFVMWLVMRQFVAMTSRRPMHDLDALVGQIGVAASDVFSEGSVQVNGELWSARSQVNVPSGSSVRVIAREGFMLVVEKD